MAPTGTPSLRGRKRRLADGALAVIGAAAFSLAPSPTPDVAGVLAPPPTSSYVADTESTGSPLGPFDAAEYAGYLHPDDPRATEADLTGDGFVAAYGAGWTEQATGRGLVELVIAFSGGNGARKWLASAQAGAQSSEYFRRSITVAGIGPYYGVHYVNPDAPAYADVVSFVKGNDFFTVGFVSTDDDLGEAAPAQARKQFDSAPADSIPPAQWPENLHLLAGGIDLLKVAVLAAVAVVVVGFGIALVLFVLVRRGARRAADGKLSWDGDDQPPDG